MNTFPVLLQSHEWLDAARLSTFMPEPLPSRLAVGWSGGADSTALLLALKACGYEVHAWHVDHGWHSDSAEQADQLAKQAEAWGILFSSIRLSVASENNREAEARSGRYKAFQTLAKQSGLTDLCLAHHRDDQAETVFMRMLQGAGVHGLRGMQAVRMRGELRLFRPFLHLTRHEIIEGLQRSGVNWLEDQSNHDMTLWRNRLRRETFPAFADCGANPAELFLRWQKQAVNVVERIDSALEPIAFECSKNECSLSWQAWQRLTPLLRVYLLQQMMQRLFGEGTVAGRRHIDLMHVWMEQGGRGGLDLSRCRLMRKDGRLCLFAKPMLETD